MFASSEIAIVGGGPSGLMHAWGLKKLNSNLRVVIFEKYEQYQRSHTLVMQYEQLEKLMQATNSEHDPDLVKLRDQLKRDPNIRTNDLEEVFKKIALRHGVIINTEEIHKDTIEEQIKRHCKNPKLIIGADGTHGVVNDAFFPEGNQIKHEFDYVLQFRYEVQGEHKAPAMATVKFYQDMARHGFIANEYVGHFADNKTPITMQMMISKEAFEKLKKATSKKPIKPFVAADSSFTDPLQAPENFDTSAEEDTDASISDLKFDEIPANVRDFLNRYLQEKIKECHKDNQLVDKKSVRISVNEAPATHAQEVFTNKDDTTILLVGDAALGLSYFKGLNAAIEAAAKFFTTMKTEIKNAFIDQSNVKQSFDNYQDWFSSDFAPRKIKEVEEYSTWRIRAAEKFMKIIHRIKMGSVAEELYRPIDPFKDYFYLFNYQSLANLKQPNWRFYPHRAYDPVHFGEFSAVPVQHSLLKIGKLFADYVKPYKSTHQVKEDFKQPLVGFANFFLGLGKTIIGGCTLNSKLLGDGVFTLIRGVLEIITIPLALIVKPITRGIATRIHGGYKKIEENSSLRKLAKKAHECLDLIKEDQELSKESTYHMLAMCNDLHRKFVKSINRGQKTTIKELDEITVHNNLRKDNKLDKASLQAYFSLFYQKPVNAEKETPGFKNNTLNV